MEEEEGKAEKREEKEKEVLIGLAFLNRLDCF